MIVTESQGTDFREMERLAGMRASLTECLDRAVELWRYDDQRWWKVTTENDAIGYTDEGSLSERATAWAALAGGERRVTWLPGTDGQGELLLYLPHRRSSPLLARAGGNESERDSLVRLGRLFAKHTAAQDELEEMRQEQHAFLCQVTNDFEELTLLRSMANLLDATDLTFGLESMAQSILPTLQPLIQSEALVLLGAVQPPPESNLVNGAMLVDVSAPLVWMGQECVAWEVCTALTRRYRELAAAQPVVKNYFRRLPEAAEYPGVESFILVPIVSGEILTGWLLAINRRYKTDLQTGELPWDMAYHEFGSHEATLLSSSAAILATQARNVQLFQEREELLVNVVRALVSAVEAKDEYTRGHSERVGLYGKRIAQEMGLDHHYCEKLYLAGLLHDIGKIGIRDAVLRKPGVLTPEEVEEIKQHPDKGWQILQDLEQLSYVLNGVLYHHEQYDGHGYPDQLRGQEIPLEGRILAVADAYDAMTSDRPYRPGMPSARAEAILRSGAGRQWDPDVVQALFRCLDSILTIKSSYQPPTPRQRRALSAANWPLPTSPSHAGV